MESSDNNKPAAEFRINGLKAVVWENETKNGSMYNTTLVRVYKDKNDEWQETNSLGRDDLLAALTDAWPDLPEAVRAGIAAMVAAARPSSEGGP